MNEENIVMNAVVSLMVCPRHPGAVCCTKCSYAGSDNCYESLIADSMNVLNGHFCGREQSVGSAEPDYDYLITKHLRMLGVPANLVGYRHIKCAVQLILERPEYLDTITFGLYPTVGKMNGVTAPRVERGIRHAVEVMWQRGDLDVLTKYFGNTVSIEKGKPTNSEFIAAVAEHIRLEGRTSSK